MIMNLVTSNNLEIFLKEIEKHGKTKENSAVKDLLYVVENDKERDKIKYVLDKHGLISISLRETTMKFYGEGIATIISEVYLYNKERDNS